MFPNPKNNNIQFCFQIVANFFVGIVFGMTLLYLNAIAITMILAPAEPPDNYVFALFFFALVTIELFLILKIFNFIFFKKFALKTLLIIGISIICIASEITLQLIHPLT